jgi:2-polyprenyl-3-methyl-5-hydroxy-6-metoxy-1,4-benzoquinol methylase
LAVSRYTAEINLEDVNDPHSLAILELRPGSLVLDIGAADGSVARELVQRGCRVIAVEADPEAAKAAERHCERVVIGDVETLDLVGAMDEWKFDAVLLLDVLEHLRDPLATLKAAASLLQPSGRMILSVPNVTHAALRLQLLAGSFEYTETGLLDRTHLHLFDRSALERLVMEAGLTVIDRLRTTAGLTETEISIDPEAFPPEAVALALGGEDADTYQFVYVVSTEPATAAGKASVSLGEALQRRAAEAERLRGEAEVYVRTLETRVAELERERDALAEHEVESRQRLESLEEELRRRMGELERLHDDLEHVRMDIAIKDAQLVQLRGREAPIASTPPVPGAGDTLDNFLGRHPILVGFGAATRRYPRLHRTLRRIGERIAARL